MMVMSKAVFLKFRLKKKFRLHGFDETEIKQQGYSLVIGVITESLWFWCSFKTETQIYLQIIEFGR